MAPHQEEEEEERYSMKQITKFYLLADLSGPTEASDVLRTVASRAAKYGPYFHDHERIIYKFQ